MPRCGCSVRPNTAPSAEQVYRLAAQKISRARAGQCRGRADRTSRPTCWRACPPLSCIDLDETVLDNTVYQARLVRDHTNYNPASWGEWVGAGEADAMPGAREFIAAARKLGHTVFFLTNRDCTTPRADATDAVPGRRPRP